MSGTEDDDASSFGDDESGMDDDEEGPSHGLPLDLVGQDIEDLGYGNGKTHMELKREMRDAPPDAENEDEDVRRSIFPCPQLTGADGDLRLVWLGGRPSVCD